MNWWLGEGCTLTFDTKGLAEAVDDGILVDLSRLHPVSLGKVCEWGTDIGVAECGCVQAFLVGEDGRLVVRRRAGVVWVVGVVSCRLLRDDELVWRRWTVV
jgi:hypothetical protein